MTPVLAATLAAVADAMAPAREPWWVIGSAAVALHTGGDVGARDVDVMIAAGDAAPLADRLGLPLVPGGDDPRFRSTWFLAWHGAAMPVEFMAGFALKRPDGWHPVTFAMRQAIAVGDRTVFVPARDELRALLHAFDRDKDRARAALLQGCPTTPRLEYDSRGHRPPAV